MRILSSFRDYYDGVQAHGQNQGLIYERKTVEITAEERRNFPEPPDARLGNWLTPGLRIEEWRGKHCGVFARPFWLAVAGKVYRGYRLRRRREDVAEDPGKENTAFVYSGMSLSAAAVEMGVLDPRRPLSRIERRNGPAFSGEQWLSRQGTEELREALAGKGIIAEGAMLDYKHRPDPLVINPRLADFEFYKVLDAFTVFQELEMWLGGVLPQHGAPIATVPDAYRFEERGFDGKTSFRRDKAVPR